MLFRDEMMVEEIISNLYRIEVPLPGSPLKFINSYVIKDSYRNLIIDTGMNLEECMDVMQKSLSELGVDLENTDFFITHCHGDHFGLVSRLVKDESIVYINKVEADTIDIIKSGGLFDDIESIALMSGFPEKDIKDILSSLSKFEFRYRDFSPFRFVEDGDSLSIGDYQFRCVATPGHRKGHMCLYEANKRILFSGDHLLGDITPGIQARYDNENPLQEYLLSLEKIYELDIELVLPGHRGIFRNFRERIKELKGHHQDRADEVISILGGGSMNAYYVASQMTWNIMDCDTWDDSPSLQKYFATGEALAHLRYLEEKGIVRKETKEQWIIYSLNVRS